MDELLKSFGIESVDKLRPDELPAYEQMLRAAEVAQRPIEPTELKEFISQMKYTVEMELTATQLNRDQEIFLKARLRNYILLEAFLDRPAKARAAIDRQKSRK